MSISEYIEVTGETPGMSYAPAAQQPLWPDAPALARVESRLAGAPPLVFAGEVDTLRTRLAAVQQGRAFLLQGGDCAETLNGCSANAIRGKLQTLLQMALILTYAASVPVVKVGRIAGQYAKPRSSDTETRAGVTLPSYRGDAVNSEEFTLEGRTPDPQRLLDVYHASASTLNLVRAFTQGGFADLHEVHRWNRGFLTNTSAGERYTALTVEIERAVRFLEAWGEPIDRTHSTEVYASHEALLMAYERPLVRVDGRSGNRYSVSGHLLWIGERTRQLGGAHVELLAGLRNPLAIKIGPTATVDGVVALANKVDPEREPGRLTLVTRMGAERIREVLPGLVSGVEDAGIHPAWVCDPMHGNTVTTHTGVKTRHLTAVVEELRGFFEVHHALGTWPGGLHVELTGDDVTECVGGAWDEELVEGLTKRYETACDPRLNHAQSIELAFLVAEMLRDRH